MFKNLKKFLSFTTISIIFFSLVSCNNNDTGSKERDRKGRANNEIVVSMGKVLPHDFDPKLRYGVHNESQITHSTLLRRTADINIIGDLAKSYSISDNRLVWTFILNTDFKYSNGELVTAEDVKFTYEMLKKDGKGWDLSFIDKIKILAKNKIEFHLKKPRSTFTAQLSEIPIVPEKYYGENYKYNPIGSGPYMVKEYKPNEQAILVINPHYHGKKPFFEKWTWVMLDENTALAALESGDVDVIYATPELADKKVQGIKLIDIESNDVRGLSLPYIKKGVIDKSPSGSPVGNDVTSDPAIRKALNIGMNRDKFVKTVLNGYGKPAYSVIDKTPFFENKAVIKDNRVDEAKKLLDDAGWIAGNDGIRIKDGLKAEFDLYYATSDQLRANLAVEAVSQAKKLGIKINLVGSNWSEISKKLHDSSILYGGGRHHANQFYESHHPDLAGKGWTNITFYKNDHVTAYLDKAMNAKNIEEANKYWKLAQWDGTQGVSVLGDLPFVWLVRMNHTYLVDKRINIGHQGVHSHGHDWAILDNIAEWTWEEVNKNE